MPSKSLGLFPASLSTDPLFCLEFVEITNKIETAGDLKARERKGKAVGKDKYILFYARFMFHVSQEKTYFVCFFLSNAPVWASAMGASQDCDHMVQKLPYWNANCQLGHLKQRKFRLTSFVLDVPVRNLRSSMAVFVPCDHYPAKGPFPDHFIPANDN